MRILGHASPALPEEMGSVWSHNTGNEHATKFMGSEHVFNHLRRELLVPLSDQPIRDYSPDEFMDMLLGDEFEFVFADIESAQSTFGSSMIGCLLGQREVRGTFEKRMTVRDIVVHPEYQQYGLGSFMLGQVIQKERYGDLEQTELVIDNTAYEISDGFLNGLVGVGFNHTDEHGSPALWLPGNEGIVRGTVDTHDPEIVAKLIAAMPADWNGYLRVTPNGDTRTEVYRNGTLVGRVRSMGGSHWDDDFNEMIGDFAVFDPGNAGVGRITEVTHDEAIRALLNKYELVTA
jgi:ribosomal protein S18 acetylase RimI-like enzyme